MSSLAQLSPGRSLEDFSSISGYFISRLSQTEGGQIDFTLEQISYLCEIEPQHCSTLINTLDSVLGMILYLCSTRYLFKLYALHDSLSNP